MDSNTIAKLQEEHKLLADRAKSSRDEADQIRSALKQQQSVLNQAESELNQAQAELTQLESQIQSLQLELKNKQAQAQSAQEALGLAHQKTAELAQSLGPVAQKQKRFEDALAMVVQNLAAANQAPTPPHPPAPPVLPTPAVPNIMPKAPNAAVPPSIPMPSSSANMQSAKVDSEKRAPRRDIEMSLSFEIALDSGSEHNFYTGLTDNISEGGIFIATTQILDIGTQIKFPLALPSMLEPEQVEGVVKWVRREGRADANVPSGIGIQFTQISDSFKARINQYIQSSDTIFYDD